MNTFWLKMAGVVVAILGVIVLVNVFSSSEPEPEPEHKPETFHESVERDRNKFLTKPKPTDSGGQESKTSGQQPTKQTPKPPKTVTLYFSELSEIDEIEAERLLNVAVPGRSIGRLPMTGFKLMVDNCRRIIERWPDSWYAYRAKQMLADMPPRFRPRYHITEEELDLSRFAEPRPGTKPFVVEIVE
ncbi:MAG: hypothetical protein ACYS30_24410 [Planctomycetota bacterium]|jgi:hypothetical protein